MIAIYTDGACAGNPGGRGGWAWIRVDGLQVIEDSGFEASSTNNRMELQAAIEAMESLGRNPVVVTVYSDSRYLVDGMTKWMKNWVRRRWVTRSKQAVKNQDLWMQLSEVSSRHRVDWQWIRGHNGHAYNERCDQLANEQAGIV
jgi:ribonuclease HI